MYLTSAKAIVLAMPGSGKSYFVKQINERFPYKIAVDFDIPGLHMSEDTRVMYTAAVLSHMKDGYRFFFTHAGSVDIRLIPRDIDVYVVVPKDPQCKELIAAVESRGSKTRFALEYHKNASQYRTDWLKLAAEAKAFRPVHVIYLNDGEHLSDVLGEQHGDSTSRSGNRV